jgi:hypothetical protein
MPTGKHYFVEQTQDGRYAVRASGLRDTQEEARAYARELNPDDHADVERATPRAVCGTSGDPISRATGNRL